MDEKYLYEQNLELDLGLAYLNNYIDESNEVEEDDDCNEEVLRPDYSEEEEEESEDSDDNMVINEYDNKKTTTSRPSAVEMGFDAHGLEACLVSNQIYQDYLVDVICQMENALSANREKQKTLQEDLNLKTKEEKGIVVYEKPTLLSRVLTAPYFRDDDGFYPPKNEDFHLKIANDEFPNYLYSAISWTTKEKVQLINSVRSNARKHLMEPLQQRIENIRSKYDAMKTQVWSLEKEVEGKDAEIYKLEDEMQLKIKAVEDEIDTVGKFTDKELFSPKIQKREIDWVHISVEKFSGKRNPTSCMLMWKFILNPLINRHPWTDDENERLKDIAVEHELRDWDSIANDLGTCRTSIDCFEHFQTSLNAGFEQKGAWSKEENESLVKLVDKYTLNGVIQWKEVYPHFPNRHKSRIRTHYYNTLCPTILKGPFSLEEDLLIYLGFLKYGKKFQLITNLLTDRTYQQVRMRFVVSVEDQKIHIYTPVEDKEIVRLAKEHNCNWSEVSKYFPGISNYKIAQRYKSILQHIPEAHNLIDDPNFKWPLTMTFSRTIYLRRRTFFRDYMEARLKSLRQSSKKLPQNWTSLKKFYPNMRQEVDLQPVELPKFTLDELDFMIKDLKSIVKKQRIKIERGYKPRTEETIEKHIDDIFLQNLNLLCYSSKKLDLYSLLEGKKAVECNTITNVIHKTMQVKRMDLFVPAEEMDYDNAEEIEFSSFRKLINRQKDQIGEITNTIYETCINPTSDNDCDGSNPKSVLPPNLATIDAFHRMVMDRTRLASMAMGIENPKVVHSILGKRALICSKCQAKIKSVIDLDAPSTSKETDQNGQGSASPSEDSPNVPSISEIEKPCQNCETLVALRDSYNILRRRFVSCFLWPGLLSVVPVPAEDLADVAEIEEVKKSLNNRRDPTPVTKTGKLKRKKFVGGIKTHLNSAKARERRQRMGLPSTRQDILKYKMEQKAKKQKISGNTSNSNMESSEGKPNSTLNGESANNDSVSVTENIIPPPKKRIRIDRSLEQPIRRSARISK